MSLAEGRLMETVNLKEIVKEKYGQAARRIQRGWWDRLPTERGSDPAFRGRGLQRYARRNRTMRSDQRKFV